MHIHTTIEIYNKIYTTIIENYYSCIVFSFAGMESIEVSTSLCSTRFFFGGISPIVVC